MGRNGTIVVFAKCPLPGSSKTRLAPLLGDDGAALLAQAMLSDVLSSLTACDHLQDTLKLLVYAPGDSNTGSRMTKILASLGLSSCSSESYTPRKDTTSNWVLMPMLSDSSDLTSSSLGDKLMDSLTRARELDEGSPVLFLGMDSPEVPTDEIVRGLETASSKDMPRAYMCPANDGGYGLLALPSCAPTSVFSGIRWSCALTAVSQLKALSDSGIDVSIGRLMYDIDEPEDVSSLAKRLSSPFSEEATSVDCNDVLSRPPFEISRFGRVSDPRKCPHTTEALSKLELIG
ncbi:hypothetical protein THAOC_28109 [Thalassiosira oceanica]|uniref:Glycosyltransferase n=1 Tax=Thalassiosira oceanica TaxID=159749 RepID=K0S136_THAOC|nr:hypothetical protein THAOC_28109 [Thalassiosira oceanica]|eukprot:EJK52597.1 hypothetical protein THAOC_28109 [Thalassiosira oceanica]